MKLGIVVQRYGADIGGGAELHAQYVAEHLSRHVDVRVLTTCARDYLTWRNELPHGTASVNGIPVERFPVAHERSLSEFACRSAAVFGRTHSWNDELKWLKSEGPVSPGLIDRLAGACDEFDYIVFFSARYYHSYHGARAVLDKALLVPTAEREPSVGLSIVQSLFRSVRAIMYNSPEERALIQALSGNHHVPHAVVGIGSEIPEDVRPERFRRQFAIDRPFVVYIGRIDDNKGCGELFRHFRSYTRTSATPPLLLLIGTAVMDVPHDPHIRHLGYVSHQAKFDALAAADALLMPSYYESLSMAVLEAWALGRPVIVNGRCDVLLGQCLRSNGGLYYRDAIDFCAALDAVVRDRALATTLGERGRQYYGRHYAWPVIERKYLDMFARLDAESRKHGRPQPVGRLEPGWWARGRPHLPAAADVVNAAPSGPVEVTAELTSHK